MIIRRADKKLSDALCTMIIEYTMIISMIIEFSREGERSDNFFYDGAWSYFYSQLIKHVSNVLDMTTISSTSNITYCLPIKFFGVQRISYYVILATAQFGSREMSKNRQYLPHFYNLDRSYRIKVRKLTSTQKSAT